ncbi:MAG: helix-turn-helix domain-containing protein [Ruminococcaceae bacterium]|nr:helix-turn-helix domain-containing protein [Oscillospiraceae bacterium]
MDLSKTGKLIARLRREKGLTQKDVAEKLGICAKTVSKWETGHGFPDVSFISELSRIFAVDPSSLLEGEMPKIKPEVGNVKRTKFYVCETCGNILTSIGNAEMVCCGRKLSPLAAKKDDAAHKFNIQTIEDDFYITFSHPMTKEHYISFVAYVRFDRVLTVRLYPEQGGELRFPQMRGGKMYYYCNTHGLFALEI